MAIVKLAPNVPEAIDLKYADLKAGQYGPQVQLKGSFEGADRIIYVPVDCAAVLVKAGAQAVETDKGTTYKPVSGRWIVEKRQQAGEKYGTVYLYRDGEPPVMKAAQQPLTEKPHALQTRDEGLPWETSPKDEQLVKLYWTCFDTVLAGLKTRKLADGPSWDAIVAMCATIYIARSKLL